MTIDDIQYTGFETSFELPKSTLQKTWWKYSKKIGILDNRKTHYLIKIPATEKGLSPVSLVQTTTGDKQRATIFLAVLDQTNNEFKEQVKQVLLEFKIKYYVEEITGLVRKKEKELVTEGALYNEMITANLKNGLELSNPASIKLLKNIRVLNEDLDDLKSIFLKIQQAAL